jgi:hydroxymethylglutaryl-CoA lyase
VSLPKNVTLREVGPRDGLRNESVILPVLTKLQLIRSLIDAGASMIEVTGFEDSDEVPQFADAEDIVRQLPRRTDVVFSAWVGDVSGIERALAAGMEEVVISTAASPTFHKKVFGRSLDEHFERLREVAALARRHQVRLRGAVQTSFHCPYDGKVDPKKVVDVASRLLDLGCIEVSIDDTVGRATPKMVWKLLDRLLKKTPAATFAGHFRDTYGMAVSNVLAAVGSDIRTFETSIGGLGVCPYAPDVPGNVATEDLVFVLEGMGIRTNVALDKLIQTSARIERFLNHPIASKVYQAEKSRL